MIFISYYTSGVYKDVMNNHLLPSLKRWNLQYDIEEVKDFGSWQLNTGFKSKFIKKMLLKHKQNICFLDADATIEQYPDLLFNIPDETTYEYKRMINVFEQINREYPSGVKYLSFIKTN